MSIRIINKEELERDRWNGCVHYASNGNIFGYKWYLDAIAKDWEALVEGNYESVMPLMYQELKGKKQLHRPFLIREAGIYSVHVLSPARINNFLAAIPEEYGSLDIHFNVGTSIITPDHLTRHDKSNYQLSLTSPYEEIAGNYSSDFLRKLDAAQNYELRPLSLKPERIAGFYRSQQAKTKETEQVFHGLQRIMYNALHRGWGFGTGITNAKGDLLAADFFIYSHGRVMSLAASSNKAGLQQGAPELLLDLLIRNHAGRPIELDFNSTYQTPANIQLAKAMGAEELTFYSLENQVKEKAWWKIW